MVVIVRSLEDRLLREEEEERRREEARRQAAAFRAWMDMGDAPLQAFMAMAPSVPTPGQMNPVGRQYESERAEDSSLRPSSWVPPAPPPMPVPTPTAPPPRMPEPTAQPTPAAPVMPRAVGPVDYDQMWRELEAIQPGRINPPAEAVSGAGILGPILHPNFPGAAMQLEQRAIAERTTPVFQGALAQSLGRIPGMPEAVPEVGGMLAGQVALPSSVVPFVGPVGRLGTAGRIGLRAAQGAPLAAVQERAYIREFEEREPSLLETGLAAGAGGLGAGLLPEIPGALRRLRGRAPEPPVEDIARTLPTEPVEAGVAAVPPGAGAPPGPAAVERAAQPSPVAPLGEESARAAEELERLGVSPIRGTSATVDKLTDLIKSAKRLKPAERAARSQELARRAARAGQAMERAEGRGRLGAGLGQLKGELPSPQFTPPEGQLNPGEVTDLFNTVADVYRAQEGQVFTQLNTMQALEKILMGKLPQENELDLLERVFGGDLIDALQSQRSLGTKAWDELMGLINAPRTLMTTFDVSGILRQAVTTVGSREFYGNIPLYLRSFASQRFTDAAEDAIKSHKLYQRALDDKLALTFGGRRALPLAEREEAFMLPGERTFIGKLIRKIPGVRQSERGHLTFLSKLRLDMYANNIDKVAKGEGDALASMINAFTGRGEIGPLKQYTPLLSGIFFSARRQASLVQIPLSLFSRSSHVRKLAARNLLAFVGAGTSLLSLVKLSGVADVEMDPRSSNFGKIRVGPTRMDLWGGFQPMARLAAQIATGERKTSAGAITDVDLLETVGSFLRNKLSPPASEVVDVAKGETAIGEPIAFTPEVIGREAYENLTSLFLQDVADAVREGGWSHGLLAAPAVAGVGVQTYTTPTEALAERFDKKYPDLAPYNPAEGHRSIVNADPELAGMLPESEQAEERGEFLGEREQELGLPEKAQAVLGGNIPAVAGFREAYEDFRSTAADAAARDFFGTEEREPTTPEERRYRAYQEISPWEERFRNPETLEINWDLYGLAKDAAFVRLPDALQQAIETRAVAQDEDVVRLAQAIKDWRNQLDSYYAEDERRREAFRRRNPDVDAILWITGSTTGVFPGRAQNAAVRLLREAGIRINRNDVARRSGGGGIGGGLGGNLGGRLGGSLGGNLGGSR